MKTILKTTMLSAMIGLGGLAATAPAHADSVQLRFSDRDGPRVVIRDNDRRYDDRRDFRRPVCSPARALDKAQRLGLRRARVVDVDRRSIDVVGRKFGDRVTVTFGRAPNCPIVRW